jgi:15-cis-phytoene synthase
MKKPLEELAPPVRLALAYTPKQVRAAWELVLRFDSRFAGIIGATSEPLIGQMKLAWWRDALGTAAPMRPKGEPLLSELSEVADPQLDRAAADLVEAWEALVVTEEWTSQMVQRFAEERGTAVFGAYARLCAMPDFPGPLAQQWAAGDLRLRFGIGVPQLVSRHVDVPNERIFRPLNILAMSVRDISGPRLIWHALTGR